MDEDDIKSIFELQDEFHSVSGSSFIGEATTTPPERDSDYYFKIVIFKVENTLFAVPRNEFEVSGTVFEAMFALPPDEMNSLAEGSSDENPICLDGISKDYFKGFLGALYPSRRKMTYNEWVGALHLATMWEFRKVREEAIAALNPLVATQDAKVNALLAKKYRVVDWLRKAYTQLVQRSSLTIVDLSTPDGLDWETIAKIFYLRESTPYAPGKIYYYCSNCGNTVNIGSQCCRQTTTQLEEVFRTEFDSMKDDSGQVDPQLPKTVKPLSEPLSEPTAIKKKKKKGK